MEPPFQTAATPGAPKTKTRPASPTNLIAGHTEAMPNFESYGPHSADGPLKHYAEDMNAANSPKRQKLKLDYLEIIPTSDTTYPRPVASIADSDTGPMDPMEQNMEQKIQSPLVQLPPLPEGMVPASPSLTGIPVELRKTILRYALVIDGPVRSTGLLRGYYQLLIRRIATINKQIYKEAMPIFYEENTFYMEQYDKMVDINRCIAQNPLMGQFLPPPPPLPAPPRPMPPDYERMIKKDLDNLLMVRQLPRRGETSRRLRKAEMIEQLREWDDLNAPKAPSQPRRRVMPLNNRALIDTAESPADGSNTVIITPGNFLRLDNASAARSVRVLNLPKPSVRPFIRFIACHLIDNEPSMELYYDTDVVGRVRQAYFIRARSFTRLKTLQVVLFANSFGRSSAFDVDVDLDQEVIGTGYVVPTRLRSVLIAMDREEDECSRILMSYLDMRRRQGAARAAI